MLLLTDNANPLEGFVNLYDIQFSNTRHSRTRYLRTYVGDFAIWFSVFPICFIRLRARCGRLAGQ